MNELAEALFQSIGMQLSVEKYQAIEVGRGANLDEPVLSTIPTGCTVGFTGYCLGQKVADATAGTPDVRWFRFAPPRAEPRSYRA